MAIHQKSQTRRAAEGSTQLYGEAAQHRMRLSVDCYMMTPRLPPAIAAEPHHRHHLQTMNISAKGIAAAILSNVLFSMLFFYGTWLAPMRGTDIFAWRMVGMFASFLVLLGHGSAWRQTQHFLRDVGHNWRRWALIILPTPIFAGQMWLFMWAPLNGKGVEVAMGYFLFPLAMMLGGVCFFRERLAPAQRLAVALAAAGVALELLRSGSFSWATVFVFATYPVYYLLRRWQGVPALTGLMLDVLLILPFALLYLLYQSQSPAMIAANPWLLFWIALLGVHGAVAQQLNLSANALLPVIIFGILSYLEPALLFVIATVFLGEPLQLASLASYGLIWAGIAVMMRYSIREARKGMKKPA